MRSEAWIDPGAGGRGGGGWEAQHLIRVRATLLECELVSVQQHLHVFLLLLLNLHIMYTGRHGKEAEGRIVTSCRRCVLPL